MVTVNEEQPNEAAQSTPTDWFAERDRLYAQYGDGGFTGSVMRQRFADTVPISDLVAKDILANRWDGRLYKGIGKALTSSPTDVADPEFKFSDYSDQLAQMYPRRAVDRFSTATSLEELQDMQEDYERSIQDAQILADAGPRGSFAAFISGLADPINLLTLGTPALLRSAGMQATTRVGSIAQTSALGALEGAAGGALNYANTYTQDPSQILLGAAFGTTVGAAAGALTPVTIQTRDALIRTAEEIHANPTAFREPAAPTLAVDETPVIDAERSVGSATVFVNRDPVPFQYPMTGVNAKKIYDNAADYLSRSGFIDDAAETTSDKIAGKPFSVLSKIPALQTDFDVLWNSGSQVLQALAAKTMESAYGVIRGEPVAILGEIAEQRIARAALENQELFYRQWLQETSQKANDFTRAEFNREIVLHQQAVYWDDAAGMSRSKAIQSAGMAYDNGSQLALKIAQGGPGEIPVRGMETLDVRKGWAPRRWSYNGIRKALDTYSPQLGRTLELNDLVDTLAAGYQRVYPEASPDKLTAMAKMVLNRAYALDEGIDTNAYKLLQENGVDFLVNALHAQGLSKADAESFVNMIRKNTEDKSVVGYARHRAEVDLREDIGDTGLKLADLTDMDIARTWLSYARSVGFTSASARHGIQADDIRDWINAAKDELSAKGLAQVDQIYLDRLTNIMLGRQLNEAPEYVGHMKRLTQLSLMNAMGLVQAADTGNLISLYGWKSFVRTVPQAARDLIDQIKTGKVSDNDAVRQLADMNIAIVGEDKIMRSELLLDEIAYGKRGEGVFSKLSEWLGTNLPKGIKLQRMISLFDYVHRFQHIMNGRMFINLMTRLDTLPEKRLADMGLTQDPEFFTRLTKRYFGPNGVVSRDADGFVTNLNLDAWEHADIRKFEVIVNRVSKQVIQAEYSGEGNALYGTAIGQLVTQFKRFPLLAAQKQTLRNMRLRDPVALGTTVWGMVTGGLMYAAREAVSGKEEKNLDIEGIIKGGLGYSSVLSAPIMFLQPALAIAGVNDDINITNYTRPGVGIQDDVLPNIPAWDTLNKMAHIPEAAASLLLDTGWWEFDKKDVLALKSAPFGNWYVTNWIFNQVNAELDAQKAAERKARRVTNIETTEPTDAALEEEVAAVEKVVGEGNLPE